MRLVLASASPRRADLLRTSGFSFETRPVDVDECPRLDEEPLVYVERLALEKARACAREHDDEVVLGADTVVVVDGAMLGKPRDTDEAGQMLRRLSGRTHEVLTGVALVDAGGAVSEVDVSRVEFAVLSDEEVAWYVASGEPSDKAGGYAVQGLASRFVTRIEGSYSNVVGLPVARVYRMLRGRAGAGDWPQTVTR